MPIYVPLSKVSRMYPYATNMKLSFFLQVLLLVSSASSDNSKDREECAESLVGLSTCLPYVGGTAKAPTQDCCSGLKQVLRTKKKCLCVVIKDRNDPDLGLNINVTLALGLPDVCSAPANISQCPALLNLPPNSPDAQVFYQFGHSSTNSSSTATSPAAGGPTPNVEPSPVSAPTGGNTLGSTAQQRSDGHGKGRRWLGLEIMAGVLVLLLSTLVV